MKRSQQKIITEKSKVLRFMRISKKIPQSLAARAAECSEAAIGHYENGRMDIPEDRLTKLLRIYGYSYKDLEEYLNGKPVPIIDVRDDCLKLLDQIRNEEKLRAVHTILKSFTIA